MSQQQPEYMEIEAPAPSVGTSREEVLSAFDSDDEMSWTNADIDAFVTGLSPDCEKIVRELLEPDVKTSNTLPSTEAIEHLGSTSTTDESKEKKPIFWRAWSDNITGKNSNLLSET